MLILIASLHSPLPVLHILVQVGTRMIHGYSMRITERFSTIVAYKWYILINSTPITFHSLLCRIIYDRTHILRHDKGDSWEMTMLASVVRSEDFQYCTHRLHR